MWKHNQHFKLLFSRINVLFGTSYWMSTYGKINLFLINSIYLVFSSVEYKEDSYKPNYTTSLFSLCLKTNVWQTSKVATAKNFFPSVCVIGKACFDECFLFNVIIWRHYSLYKFIFTQSIFAIAILLRSLKQVFWKMSIFYVRYLHN